MIESITVLISPASLLAKVLDMLLESKASSGRLSLSPTLPMAVLWYSCGVWCTWGTGGSGQVTSYYSMVLAKS